MDQPTSQATAPGEQTRLEGLITSHQGTATTAGLLALRIYRTNAVEFKYAKIPLHVTREVELFLSIYRIHIQAAMAERQAEIDALPPLEWLKATLAQARAAVEAANLVAAALARVEGLAEYVKEIDQKLAEMSAEGALDNA